MTAEEYQKKHDEYIKKEKYYHQKALDLEIKFFEQINRKEKRNDNRSTKTSAEEI